MLKRQSATDEKARFEFAEEAVAVLAVDNDRSATDYDVASDEGVSQSAAAISADQDRRGFEK